jgi:demethylmenaquinone methyltransferase / 2-methoxy-6-polyprenyl-1,4-benzoquinol methylase
VSPAPGPGSPVLPRAEDKRAVVEAMFDRIAGDYERVNRLISLGLDRRWRRLAIDRLDVGPGALVLDLACGTGDMSRMLHAQGYVAVGVDLSANMLHHAHDAGALVRADVSVLPMADGAVDGVTCAFALRNLVDLGAFFSECARVLRPGGRVAVIDAATPAHVAARAGHRIWFGHVVPWLGARMSEPTAYRYLSASTVYLPRDDVLRSIITDAGFTYVQLDALTFGAVKLVTATKQ